MTEYFYSLGTTCMRYALRHQCDWNVITFSRYLEDLANEENQ